MATVNVSGTAYITQIEDALLLADSEGRDADVDLLREELMSAVNTQMDAPPEREYYGEPIEEDGQYQIGGDVSKLGIAGEVIAAPVEAAMSMGTGAAADLYGNMVGGVRYAQDPTTGPMVAESTKEMLTYQPRTQGGKNILENFSKNFKWLSDAMNKPMEWGQDIYEDVPEGETAGPIREAIARNVAGLPEYIGMGIAGTGLIPKVKITQPNTLDSIKANAQNLYDKVDLSTVQIEAKAFAPFKDHMLKTLDKVGINAFDKPIFSKALTKLKAFKEPTVKQLREIKTNLDAPIKSNVDFNSYWGNYIKNQIDTFIKNATPAGVSKGKDKIAEVGKNLEEADDLWNSYKQGETLEKMKKKAKISRAVSPFGDWDTALTTEARSLLNSDRKSLGMNQETLTGLEDLIIGTKNKNRIRSMAGWSPAVSSARGAPAQTATIAASMAGLAGYSGGSVVTAAIAAGIPITLGFAAQKLANFMTKADFAALQNAIINRGGTPTKVIDDLSQKYKVNIGSLIMEANSGIGESEGTSLSDLMP